MLEDAEYIQKSIQYLNQYFEKGIQKKVEQYGFTVPQMRVIKEVVSHQGINIKQLTQNLQMTQSTVSDIVERLVKKGILVKKTNPLDKRASLIFPAHEVTQFLEKDRMDFVNESVIHALNNLQPEERKTVMEGIRLLVAAVGERQNSCDGGQQ
jgi:DNA-binding MarR family transcriptional regulator